MMQGLPDTFESYSAVFMEWSLCDRVHKGLSLDPSINTCKNTLLTLKKLEYSTAHVLLTGKVRPFCYRIGKET